MTTIPIEDLVRLPVGSFTMPEDAERLPGQQIVVTAFLIRHPRGVFLFDTGIGHHPDADRIYSPVRRPLDELLAGHGLGRSDVRLIANCHLHVDHGGGNHLFPGTPIFAQKSEHDAAYAEDYTATDQVADFPDARFELLDGEADPLPGIRIVPTPGHVPGHQSLVVETKRGRVILAGQAFNSASDFAVAHHANLLDRQGERHGSYPEWIGRFHEFDPWRVLFAHDLAIWERPGPAT